MEGYDFATAQILLLAQYLHSEANEWGGYTADEIDRVLTDAVEAAVKKLRGREAEEEAMREAVREAATQREAEETVDIALLHACQCERCRHFRGET